MLVIREKNPAAILKYWMALSCKKALCPITSTRALRRVLGKVFVMVLSCHSNDVDVFSLLLDCAFWGLTPPPSYSVVRGRGCTWSTHFVASMSFSYYSVWQELQGL